MFHPVLNQDGSVSYFRIACIVVFVTCLILKFTITPNDSEDTTTASATDTTTQTVVEPKKVDEDISNESLQKLAVYELYSNVLYLQSCAAVDKGFERCDVEFSDELKHFYTLTQDKGHDGFSLVLSANSNYKSDECTSFNADSNGIIKAYNKDGIENEKCFNGKKLDLTSIAISRDTDKNFGQIAPSGLSPIVQNISANVK